MSKMKINDKINRYLKKAINKQHLKKRKKVKDNYK